MNTCITYSFGLLDQDYAIFMNVVFLTTDMRQICFSFTAISDGVAENTEQLGLIIEPLPGLTSEIVRIDSSRQSAQIFISEYDSLQLHLFRQLLVAVVFADLPSLSPFIS